MDNCGSSSIRAVLISWLSIKSEITLLHSCLEQVSIDRLQFPVIVEGVFNLCLKIYLSAVYYLTKCGKKISALLSFHQTSFYEAGHPRIVLLSGKIQLSYENIGIRFC